jgi:hypothetical protein
LTGLNKRAFRRPRRPAFGAAFSFLHRYRTESLKIVPDFLGQPRTGCRRQSDGGDIVSGALGPKPSRRAQPSRVRQLIDGFGDLHKIEAGLRFDALSMIGLRLFIVCFLDIIYSTLIRALPEDNGASGCRAFVSFRQHPRAFIVNRLNINKYGQHLINNGIIFTVLVMFIYLLFTVAYLLLYFCLMFILIDNSLFVNWQNQQQGKQPLLFIVVEV